MISFLTFSGVKNEMQIIKDCTLNAAEKVGNEYWDYRQFDNIDRLYAYITEDPIVDMSCMDIVADKALSAVKTVRAKNSEMMLVVIADASVPPTQYIRPDVMAGALLLRPFTQSDVDTVLSECVSTYCKHFYSNDNNNCFVIDDRSGRQLVPYSKIIYFEARAKKIYLNTSSAEISFYDTLDELEKRLGDNFVRCHRSFIVSREHIKSVVTAKNIVLLDNGYEVPLSRTYRQRLKEIFK